MRLKILVVPFSILVSLILVIGYIKPDITVLQDKRVLLETKKEQSTWIATLLGNVDTLTSSLNGQPESESLVKTYLPKTMDQDRTIDMFNYLASQSGVFVSDMNMKEVVLESVREDAILTPAQAPLVTGVEGGVTPVAPVVSLKPKVQAYMAEVEVKGSYEGIKGFFDRVSHMNRYHKILTFSIGTEKDDSGEETAGVLTGSLQSRFDYFPLQPVESALNVPIFLRGTVDSSQVASLLSWVSYTVPPLMQSGTGRTNPFQP